MNNSLDYCVNFRGSINKTADFFLTKFNQSPPFISRKAAFIMAKQAVRHNRDFYFTRDFSNV